MKLKNETKWMARVVLLSAVSLALAAGVAQAQNVGVFVSNRAPSGDMGGLAGADAICQSEGSIRFPAFAGPWTAWLSDSNTDARNRIALPGASGAYVRASDGTTVIASDLAALTSTANVNLVNPIDPVFFIGWTGTGANGLRLGTAGGTTPPEFCDDWTSGMPPDPVTGLPRSWIGNANQVSRVWTENGFQECQHPVNLYCFGPGPTTPSPPLGDYNTGDSVEVKVNGDWVAGTYVRKSPFVNMQATPHEVSWKSVGSSGTALLSDADIRRPTGSIVTVGERPDPSSIDIIGLENEVIDEINQMRRDPTAYAAKLAGLKTSYKEVQGRWYLDMPADGGQFISDIVQHRADLQEAIGVLESTAPLRELSTSGELRGGANYFASDSGAVDGPNHKDSLGRTAQQRANLAGYSYGVNECIPGDQRSAFSIVASLVIDHGVPSRGHRDNLLAPGTKDIGVASKYWPEKQYPDPSDSQYIITEQAYIRTVIQCGYGRS